MRALSIDAIGSARFRDIPFPEPGAGEILVDIRHVGICGSDYNTYKGYNPLVSLPRVPGHEIGGVVAGLGAGVTGWREGQRVIVMPYTQCGGCRSCRTGRLNACQFNRTLGVQQDGGLAEAITLPAGKLIANDTLPPRHLALVEPLSVGFHAAARGKVAAGDRVVVLGCGMIGMGAVIAAAARGAEVIAADMTAAKLEMARRFGAAHTLAGGDTLPAAVQDLTQGQGADIVIEAAGFPETFTQAIDIAGYAGRVVYIGYAKTPVSYQTQYFNLKELDIHGSRNATAADFAAVIAWLEQAGALAGALISREFPFAEAEAVLPYWDQHRDALKLVVAR